MTGEERIQAEAKATLTNKLKQLSYKPLPEEVSKDRLKFLADNGDTREVILCFLNLDKARSISINQRDFDYTPRPDLLILLTVYMNDIKPVLHHFSTWQIKVFTNAIETLSHCTLDAVSDL
ncbi:hypothetical protein U0035_02685 [Niabella yanshanensis]|uniref:Uncharacterized protein n=1 Tax=Niabella yanshanensis TaxID=577386 RepID=A0ABZ0W6Y9_9BACT|nr:hypothetical protein [Niabella yanshanensis]WQD39053.1 hypothetical protein U0035_02685 [Niabella yanshanensis]